MKKGDIISGKVSRVRFPNVGILKTQEGDVLVKNVLPSQTVECRIQKKRNGRAQGQLLSVLEPSPKECESACPHFDRIAGCGGCNYQNLPYEEQLALKENQVREILSEVYINQKRPEESKEIFESLFEGIKPSPRQFAFRNKMEFSFGDAFKDGPLALGMHKRGSFYDIVTVDDCRLVDEDFRLILKETLEFATARKLSFYHRMRQEGYLRHLLVRKASGTGEILVALVTTSQPLRMTAADEVNDHQVSAVVNEETVLAEYSDMLCKLNLKGSLTGVVHIVNDSVADVVKCDRSEILSGQDFFFESLMGLRFKITPFSFFQTNSYGAKVLYETAREYAADSQVFGEKPVIYDLYSGTGTIAQLMADVAKKVIGVEIVEEAVEAAKENAGLNSLHNCNFVAGDVLKVIDEIEEKPDLIILDPPRDGIHPKALPKILNYGVDTIVYISCKPTSLARDLAIMQQAGYELRRACAVDMFPGTAHVETIVQLLNIAAKPDITVDLEVDVDEFYENVGEEKCQFREKRERKKKKGGSQE